MFCDPLKKIQKPTVDEICMVGKFYSLSNDIVTCGLVMDGVTSGVITSNNIPDILWCNLQQ